MTDHLQLLDAQATVRWLNSLNGWDRFRAVLEWESCSVRFEEWLRGEGRWRLVAVDYLIVAAGVPLTEGGSHAR